MKAFALAKSHFIPADEGDTREIVYELGEDESVESEFFGASLQNCGEFALELLDPRNTSGLRLEHGGVIVIADERSRI
jgi:hypothetical protein